MHNGNDLNLTAIVAVDQNWAIGKNGDLLFHLKSDLRNFRILTEGNLIVVGRKTLSTFPHGQPLPKRINAVVTRSAELAENENLLVARDFDTLFSILQKHQNLRHFLVGGESLYRQLLPHCKTAIVTKIAAKIPAADAFFENLDENPNWTLQKTGETQCEDGVEFCFCEYQNHKATSKNLVFA